MQLSFLTLGALLALTTPSPSLALDGPSLAPSTKDGVTLDAWDESTLIRLLSEIHTASSPLMTSTGGRAIYADWDAANRAYICLGENYDPKYLACKDSVAISVFSFPKQCMSSSSASAPGSITTAYNLNRPLSRRAPVCTFTTVKCVHPAEVPTTVAALNAKVDAIMVGVTADSFGPTDVIYAPSSVVKAAGHTCISDGLDSLTTTIQRVTVECMAG